MWRQHKAGCSPQANPGRAALSSSELISFFVFASFFFSPDKGNLAFYLLVFLPILINALLRPLPPSLNFSS